MRWRLTYNSFYNFIIECSTGWRGHSTSGSLQLVRRDGGEVRRRKTRRRCRNHQRPSGQSRGRRDVEEEEGEAGLEPGHAEDRDPDSDFRGRDAERRHRHDQRSDQRQ
jgi:hypothetical protein